MKILTLENRTYTLEKIPAWVDEKLRFAVLDNGDPENPDFFYIPLIFLESFNAPAAVLQIGDHKIKMPLDWKMLIGEQGQPEMHVLPITSLNDRGFDAFTFNPPAKSIKFNKPSFFLISKIEGLLTAPVISIELFLIGINIISLFISLISPSNEPLVI